MINDDVYVEVNCTEETEKSLKESLLILYIMRRKELLKLRNLYRLFGVPVLFVFSLLPSKVSNAQSEICHAKGLIH
jgi:hypothetical protein